jgi:hypothetical protein
VVEKPSGDAFHAALTKGGAGIQSRHLQGILLLMMGKH